MKAAQCYKKRGGTKKNPQAPSFSYSQSHAISLIALNHKLQKYYHRPRVEARELQIVTMKKQNYTERSIGLFWEAIR
ncbi:MAG: hypothetical protein DHS20C12_10830 [Pseudohongiella sp.]|nr:MAG: hypothetical protein DHS20C12_10830 [Pseudohongiella sp.]